MSTKYPFPSHVSVQSFVTVKLSDKCMYRLWKTQMLRLLESHDMLGFINESSMQVGDEHKLWNRSDALVHGWILGSLSEQAAITVLNSLESKLPQQTRFTAKHIWDQVQSMYDQQADVQEEEEERKVGYGSPCIDLMQKVREKRDGTRNKQALYDAVECGKLQQVVSILNQEKVAITESISINGNTALHIAMAYKDDGDGFLKSMLDLTDIPLTEVRNSDGSTPLHLAASFGNTNAAKILLDRSPDLLHAKDNQGCTPLDIIVSRPWNKEMCLFFKSVILPDIEHADHELLVINAICSKHFDLALTLIQRCNNPSKSPAVLMAIAQNCPADFTPNQLIIYELLRTPVLHFITRGTSNMKGCMKLANLVLRAVLAYPFKMLIRICIKLQVFIELKEIMKERRDARDLLDVVCALIQSSNKTWSYRDFYTEAMLEAIRRDASDVVETLVYWFPEATLIVDEDGHNFAQESSKVDEHFGNNFLHFAARLGPARKLDLISCPPFRMQRELQWFKVAQEIVPQGWRTEKNCLRETPDMVFKKEHKDLEIESGEWIKRIANSVTITATLIITVMFASVIQVPGGNNDKGLPNFISQPAFILFQISITISAAASSLSLLIFMAIITHPLTQDDFLLRLPIAMLIGWVSLFLSAALCMLAFGAALFLLFGTNDPWILGLLASLVALPVILFLYFYAWFMSDAIADFMHSTGHFLIIHFSRRLKLVGRIFI
ncbi:putative ankyrin repeat-containing domain, PGG domain, ankyrin repeat-containing domain superfamily [Helianthus debilis subsp. tardiflorus]